MAPPMTYREFIAALRSTGHQVIEEKTSGRSPAYHNRNARGAWGPVHGVMVHHTVTRGHDSTVEICRKGYAALPGPLCHVVVCKSGHLHVVGYGRANHAGLGDPDVLARVIAEDYSGLIPETNRVDGNRHFYGFEAENVGDGKDPWPAVQVRAIERAAAALCRAHGWTEKSVIGHAEWQKGKVDPRGITMVQIRAGVKATLKPAPAPAPAPRSRDDVQDARLDALETEIRKIRKG